MIERGSHDLGLRGPVPRCGAIVTGVENSDRRAHGANESRHLGEFARVCEAEALFLARLGLQRG